MGPLAGLGDSLFWLTLVPICFSIGASYSKDGGALGIFIALILFNIINIPVKYFGLKYGYTKGSSLIQENNTNGYWSYPSCFRNFEVVESVEVVFGISPPFWKRGKE
ncbi:PTS system mannose/fructose/N -acetylgalactosamine-specific transporter subunit IID [Streptococcus pneumoniae]|nr:PTS system mannose/fructose/N -acetylgalactosamine-specific transporter subunit IID [Streptococcus pneumoniae]